jgi:hypothetical protein
MLRAHAGLDLRDDALGLVGPAVRQQPARTFGHMAAHQQDGHRQHRTEQEAGTPAQLGPQHARVQQHQAQGRAERGADPEAAVDGQVDAAAHTRRDQLVDGRVDRGVFAADADAGDEAAQRKTGKAGGERGGDGGTHVDHQRQQEQALASQGIGQPAEHQRADHRAADVE